MYALPTLLPVMTAAATELHPATAGGGAASAVTVTFKSESAATHQATESRFMKTANV